MAVVISALSLLPLIHPFFYYMLYKTFYSQEPNKYDSCITVRY